MSIVEGPVPFDVFPMVGPGPAHLRLQQSAVVEDLLHQRRPLGAERAPIGRVVRIALHVDDLRCDVLRFVAEGVDDDSASDSAIGAGGPSLGRPVDLELPRLGRGGFHVESENRSDDRTRAGFNEASSCACHGVPPDAEDYIAKLLMFQRGVQPSSQPESANRRLA